MPLGNWTPERVEAVKDLWAKDCSLSVIASQIGGGVSRSAVMGKVHRLGLPMRGKRYGEINIRAGNKDPRAPHHPRIVRVPAKLVPIQAQPIDDALIPIEQRKTILELTSHTCRWPVGDVDRSGFFFCGAEPARNSPYCSGHCLRAYA